MKEIENKETQNKTEAGKMKKTLKELTQEDLNKEKFYLDTAFGNKIVTGLTKDWWVECAHDNGGWGRSYCCTPRTEVLSL